MCSSNATHVNYYQHYPDPAEEHNFKGRGFVLPRQAYNESGLCDDLYCNTTHPDHVPTPPSYLNERVGYRAAALCDVARSPRSPRV